MPLTRLRLRLASVVMLKMEVAICTLDIALHPDRLKLDTSSRPTFRSTLQPSQMGNFKHQSLRDRDRDREGEKDRDIRDKEGHERLRHVSD